MSCKRIRPKARAEQDYWLSFSDTKTTTDQERIEFLRYDSHGGELSAMNPILLGKIRHGQFGEVFRDARAVGPPDWEGGLYLVMDYATRQPFATRSLIEWFGLEAVRGWVQEFFWLCFRWQKRQAE